jgi:hypothetical protein
MVNIPMTLFCLIPGDIQGLSNAPFYLYYEHLTPALRFGVVHERNLFQETPLTSPLAVRP